MCIASSVPIFAQSVLARVARARHNFFSIVNYGESSKDNPILNTQLHTWAHLPFYVCPRDPHRFLCNNGFENAHAFTVYSQFYAFRFSFVFAECLSDTQLTKSATTLSANKTESMFVLRSSNSLMHSPGASVKNCTNNNESGALTERASAGTCKNAEIVH